MRPGACAAQQTLSAEAASVLKHSLSLSRRRGHAQVTPLHVAATLLSSRASLLRRACLKSQPHQPSHHPLQCRALELCFNVALNRLPATPGPLLQAQPTLSNALVAALKRAQAHQRRGCIEQQQQQQPPLVSIKVDLEQLILSILDDPSVSRVMREAGFSSTAVKNNLEEDSSNSIFQYYNNTAGGIYSTPNSPPNLLTSYSSHEQSPFLFSPLMKQRSDFSSLRENVSVVMDVLSRKNRKNIVVVGDALSIAEGVVSELMAKVERGDVVDELKGVSFVKFQFSSLLPLKLMKRKEVEMNVADLKRKVESFAEKSGSVIVYTGDLKWTIDESACHGGDNYSPVEHLVNEIGKLITWYESSSSSVKVWLMGVASYQTYMKCQMKQPPLDAQWSLQAVNVPSGGLGLSLSAAASGQDPRITISENPSFVLDKKPFCVKEEQVVLTCCQECKSNYEKEVAFKSTQHKSLSLHSTNKHSENGSPKLPYWLQPHGTLEKDDLVQMRRKYNKMCQNLHQVSHFPNNSSPQSYLGRNYFYNPPNPSWPKNSIFADPETISFAYPAVKPIQSTVSPLPRFRRQHSCHIEFSFSNGSEKHQSTEPKLDSLKTMDGKEVKITLALGNSLYRDEPTCEKNAYADQLCGLIKENLPWQSETIPLIVHALVDCETNCQDYKFILIKGSDSVGKRRLACGIAKSMFGSSDLLFCMNMRKKTSTSSHNREMLEKALRNHEKIVVLVESVDYADPEFVKFLADAFDNAKLERHFASVVFILAVDGETCYDKACYDMESVIQMKLVVNEYNISSALPNLDHKRKADWDSPIRTKAQKSNDMDEVSSKAFQIGNREFARQPSSHSLDLNIKADDEDEPKSDLTGDAVTIDQQSPLRFLNKIKSCFIFNRNSDQHELAKGMFLSKLKSSFQEANGSISTISFNVEETVLEEIFRSSGLYLNGLFDQWLRDVFQTSLRVVDMEKRDKVSSIRLCLEGKGYNCAKDGYMGTCLPKCISFIG